MSNGCLSTLLVKKIILHIFCMSLTVSIEPGPCGFAEGSGRDFGEDPAPTQRGRRKQREAREPGSRGAGEAGRRAGRRGRAELLLSALSFRGLTFFLTACCSFWVLVVFLIIILFSQGEGRKKSVYKVL